MDTFWQIGQAQPHDAVSTRSEDVQFTPEEAEKLLSELAALYPPDLASSIDALHQGFVKLDQFIRDGEAPDLEAKYRALVEQLPAVVFMAYLDRGTGEAYVNPQIEQTLGFKKSEWLEDPVLWYQHIHPEDRQRWSVEASEMFQSG
ncbi:MAG TPA: PAS domain-containing protein [Terriglobales bacterium]|nr:PAS domain-containing protein [Terriglobales bacterium]